MALLEIFSPALEADDVNVLPLPLRVIYQNPHKSLGFDSQSTDFTILRDIFRKKCLALIPEFVGCGKSVLNEEQLNLAYHLIRGNLKGPAKVLCEALCTSPFLDFHASYILPLLRPIKGSLLCSKEYRGFRMLAVINSAYRTTVSYLLIPKVVFVFEVHYVMRGHKVEKSYEDFTALHAQLEKELLTLPVLPVYSLGTKTVEVFGQELAQYLMRIHVTLASNGHFSPRLLQFLDVDFKRVHTEEEGALVALLDSPIQPAQTAWHVVDEQWLASWRTFVMGRGPRRYFAPGPVTNDSLLQQLKSGKSDLVLTKHYRCVNFNVWRFYQLVHGGGPTISRELRDIYSPLALSFLQAVIMVQTRIRIFLCRAKKRVLFMRRLSTCQVAKSVILETAREDVQLRVDSLLREQRKERTRRNLESAAQFTQNMWRLKKRIVPEANLEQRRRDQDVFRLAGKVSNEAPQSPNGDDGVVIGDLLPVVHMGSTYMYTRVLTDVESGIPFSLARSPGTESAVIQNSKDASLFVPQSRLVKINAFPTSTLSFEETKEKLTLASFPLTLELERPVAPEMVPSLDQVLSMGAHDEVLRYTAFKLLLQSGIPLIKHNNGNSKSHLTTLRLSDKELSYCSSFDPRRPENELWTRFSLFQLKFVLHGSVSDAVRRLNLNYRYAFEVVSEDRGVVFELPSASRLFALQSAEYELRCRSNPAAAAQLQRPEKNPAQATQSLLDSWRVGSTEAVVLAAKCTLVVEQLRRLVDEVRASQIFVDRSGLPIRRTKPKVTLRSILEK